MKISLISAVATGNFVIGKDNKLLWSLPNDMKRFKELTVGKPCVMGRKTWESLPEKFRPLPNRENIVFSTNKSFVADGATVIKSISEFYEKYDGRNDEFMIIGGSKIYNDFINYADRLYLTYVHGLYSGDTYFPEISKEWKLSEWKNFEKDEKHNIPYSFAKFLK